MSDVWPVPAEPSPARAASPDRHATIDAVTETPDFDAIAADIVKSITAGREGATVASARAFALSVVLRIWNARGAADVAKIGEELRMMMGAAAAGPYVSNLDRALRRLDR